MSFQSSVRSMSAGTLVPVFHMLRTAALQRSRGFQVRFAGLENGAPYDLLLSRGLIDGIGDLRAVMRARFGDRVRLVPIPSERRRRWFEQSNLNGRISI